ncbi:response regulator [Gilvimarinus agarilyticus]|uniref:response regulator n=1 Tax=Gilvimarinus sp. 2_MG-2023 TaxID=3062666 RepID=UPI001C0896A9|nr:response regulator [Gilvimarinus sp. 2_MG-2023]MBU2885488.1 response regulator [Gilvimarinus agarilyticus]MDO6570388.1 response regulator [Gilvimarinus sp. 2_MG-2023]
MNTEPLVVIVEDEPKIAQILVDFFQLEGFKTQIVSDGLHASEAIKASRPQAVILDLMLPHKSGLTICEEVRAFSDVPILMLTARVDEIDRLTGLNIGADDYICKPFSPREVVTRVKVILRRMQKTTQQQVDVLSYKNLQIDTNRFICKLGEAPLDLTPVEFRLLTALVRRPGVVLSRESLMKNAYDDSRIVSDRTIDSHMKNVRTKLNQAQAENNLLHSVYGVGYKLE